MMKEKTNGITLIALIITIIIMLILVATSVQLTLNSGLFERAGEAGDKWQEAQDDEQNIKIVIGGVEATIDDIVNGHIEHTAVVNAPELIEGMIAVEWNGNAWVKADTSTNTWYEYGTTSESKRWANAVTVKATGTQTREYYQSEEAIGQEIAEEDILGMYVWIPRYSYKIVRGYHTKNGGTSQSDSGFVDIKFMEGTSSYGADIVEYNSQTTEGYTKFSDGYVVHPAFNVGNTRLTGIWVAKFEASSSTTTETTPNLGSSYGRTGSPSIGGNEVTIRPNVTSWRAVNVNDCYLASTNMTKIGNIHGLSTTADSHLMKDTEWGAVAYLTQSAYGNAQVSDSTGVWNNSYYEGDATPRAEGTTETADGYNEWGTTRTGMVGIRSGSTNGKNNSSDYYSVATNKTENEDGTITISYQSYQYYSSGTWTGSTNTYTTTYYAYETANGVKGSTTGTVYGIYDMAGGAWEYQASYLNEISSTYTNYFNTNVPAQHKVTYAGTSADRTENYNLEANKAQYGNALWETSNGASGTNSWNGDYSNFVYSAYPFVLRGGYFNDGSTAGLFCFSYSTGGTGAFYGFRPVLSATL